MNIQLTLNLYEVFWGDGAGGRGVRIHRFADCVYPSSKHSEQKAEEVNSLREEKIGCRNKLHCVRGTCHKNRLRQHFNVTGSRLFQLEANYVHKSAHAEISLIKTAARACCVLCGIDNKGSIYLKDEFASRRE
jgi:hypothetical protein